MADRRRDEGVRRGVIKADLKNLLGRLPGMLRLDEDPAAPLWRE